MFYPEDSLKRGGRFYLCWVADSWPLRFATITHRQLWSHDIRRICGDLLEVISNESGRPTQRFSLRLSSQLLRGLVRLYQRKVNILLGDLCMINSYVIKSANKKWNTPEVKVRNPRRPLQQLEVHEIVQEPTESVQRIEEMIQASGNAVANIQDITLREPTEDVINMLLKPNDGFGEENPEQPILLLQDRTIEIMLNPDASTTHGHSAMELALDVTDKSHDKSRLYLKEAQMERISEHELTMFRKSTADELIPQFEKAFNIPTDIPEIPEILPPEIPVPVPEKPQEEPVQEEPTFVAVEPAKDPEPVEIELEELEVQPQTRRRKLRTKMIVDKRTKINAQQFRARIDNPLVELRCQDSSEDIINIQVPAEQYFQRPCHGGLRIRTNIGFEISRLFLRNLGVVRVQPRAERELEEIMQRSHRIAATSMLERIEEEQELPGEPQVVVQQTVAEIHATEFQNVSEVPRISITEPMELDIADVLTQKVQTLSQAQKRIAEQEMEFSPKRQKSTGYASFKESQQIASQTADPEADKENRPANLPPQPKRRSKATEQVLVQNLSENIEEPPPTEERMVSSMLQEAGLADIPVHPPPITEVDVHTSQRIGRSKSGRGNQSDSSETQLGSLDRTKVSLGDSEQTTDSKRFIRDHWGTEGTMLKILKLVKTGHKPVNVKSLIVKGPVITGHRRVIAARCFTSILKLKQHGFIYVLKDDDTLEINDITLGTKLTSSQEQF